MTTEEKHTVPPNISEFNTVVGLVFAQLYEAFPSTVHLIDRPAIAAAMGVEGTDWGAHKLPSGKSFSDVLGHTIAWLVSQNYIISSGSHPAERVTLTDKGLAALNAVPRGLTGTAGAELIKANRAPASRDWSAIGDLAGGVIGGFTKSLAT